MDLSFLVMLPLANFLCSQEQRGICLGSLDGAPGCGSGHLWLGL